MRVGASLLDAAVLAPHSLEYRRGELWVLEGNLPAKGFYRRHRWHLVEEVRREGQIDGVSVTEVLYRRDLTRLRPYESATA